MPEFKSKIEAYIEEVCDQIRWRKMHAHIAEELADHIEDQKMAFIKAGQGNEEAEKNAIATMGDPVTVGQQLDRVHRPQPEWRILALMGIFIAISILSQYIISLNASRSPFGKPDILIDYLKILPLGIGLLALVYFTDYSIIGRYPKRLYGMVLLVCVGLCSINSLRLHGSFQHVFYFALLLMVLYAGLVYDFRTKGYKGIFSCGIAGVMTNILFVYVNSLLAARLFTSTGVILLTVAIVKGWYQVDKKKALALVWLPIVALVGMIFSIGGQRVRSGFVLEDDSVYSWIRLQVRTILSQAQWIGQGEMPDHITGTIERALPLWYGDYSLTYFIHEFGWVVGISVILLVSSLLMRMFLAVYNQTSVLGYLVSLSVTLTIGIECVKFLLLNLGISQSGSCPLPLLSSGRVSFLVNMILFGLLLSAYRNKEAVRDKNTQDQTVI